MTDMTDKTFEASARTVLPAPDTEVSVRDVFGIDVDWKVPAFSKADQRVPDLDEVLCIRPGYDARDPGGLRA